VPTPDPLLPVLGDAVRVDGRQPAARALLRRREAGRAQDGELEDADGRRLPERLRRRLEVAGVSRQLVEDVVRGVVIDAQLYLAPELVAPSSSSVPAVAAVPVGKRPLEVEPRRHRRLDLPLVELLRLDAALGEPEPAQHLVSMAVITSGSSNGHATTTPMVSCPSNSKLQ